MNDNLESIKKLQNDIKGLRLFSFLLPEKKREQIKKMDQDFNYLVETLHAFKTHFSDLGWCAYDSMPPSLMKKAVYTCETDGLDAGERVLIDYYKSEVKERIHWLKNKSEPFMKRYSLILKAFDDHFEGRYYASIPVFLIVIDGSVNDFTKSKGFFAEGTDLTAWDCLVGCSDGLTKMKNIFNAGRNKTNAEEIRMPYRNGILHGRDLNYDNEYVSCKCIALMFALADWMQMKDNEIIRKERFEKESNPPPIRETLKRVIRIQQDRKDIGNWKGRNIVIGENFPVIPTLDNCKEYEYLVPLIKAFNAWQNKNYGELALNLRTLFPQELSDKKIAGLCRNRFSEKEFLSFKLKEIEERTCVVTRILVEVTWKKEKTVVSKELEFGCVYEGNSDLIVLPWNKNGEWTLYPWNIRGLDEYSV